MQMELPTTTHGGGATDHDTCRWSTRFACVIKKPPSLGGLEPPTFRLTAERASLLRHRDQPLVPAQKVENCIANSTSSAEKAGCEIKSNQIRYYLYSAFHTGRQHKALHKSHGEGVGPPQRKPEGSEETAVTRGQKVRLKTILP